MPNGANLDSSVVIESYTLNSNLQWCEDISPGDEYLFLDIESTLMEKVYNEKKGGICFPITFSSLCVIILNGMPNDMRTP